MGAIVLLIVLVLAFGALALISTPPRPALRLRFKKDDGLIIPQVCILTGEAPAEWHILRGFTGDGYEMRKTEVRLPFSERGWARFSNAYPLSLDVFKGGLAALTSIPLLGAYLAMYVWTPLCGFVSGLAAIAELAAHKRQLVVPLSVIAKGDLVIALDVLGVSDRFMTAFLEANGGPALAEYRVSVDKRARTRVILLLVLVIALVGLLIMDYLLVPRQ